MADLYAVKGVERCVRGVGAWYGQPVVAVRFYQDEPLDLIRGAVRNIIEHLRVVYTHAQLVDAIAACLEPGTVRPHILLADDPGLTQVDVTLERVLREAFPGSYLHVDVNGTRARAFAVDWATLTLTPAAWADDMCRVAYNERFAAEVCYHVGPRDALPSAEDLARLFPRALLWALPTKTGDAAADAAAWQQRAEGLWAAKQASDGRGWRVHPAAFQKGTV